ncbi:queuosine precursor transporter [Salinivirga cyanobacteriivorans]
MFESYELTDKYTRRREVVFVVLAGLFLGTLAMLNILGISRQLDLSFTLFDFKVPVYLFVGILPYPITFLCTDFISELYGKERARAVVLTGLLINIWVLFIMWIGGALPIVPEMEPGAVVPSMDDPSYAFYEIRRLTFGATLASMIAYLTAQFVDVHIFHFLKKLTKGKHLWLRNNGSTLISQLVDSISVTLITYYYAKAIQIKEDSIYHTLLVLIVSGYIFKLLSALLDTIPFYIGVKFLSKYLDIDPNKKYHTQKE